MKTSYILVGIPASGKSTWVKSFKGTAIILSTDNYIEAFAQVQGKTYSEVFDSTIKEATSRMMDDLNFAKEEGFNIIWDQTNLNIKSRNKKLQLLDGYYKIAIVFAQPSNYELQRRLESRPGKNIPFYIINSMIDSYEEPTLEEGFDEITKVS